jgi:hypothetical protein
MVWEGAEGHIRMSFTSEEVIYEAMDRIKTVLIWKQLY